MITIPLPNFNRFGALALRRLPKAGSLLCCLGLMVLGSGIQAETLAKSISDTSGLSSPPRVRETHNIGLGAGMIGGYGLAYRHWGTNSWGYQVSAVPVISWTEDEHSLDLAAGAMLLRCLGEYQHGAILGYAGGSYQNNFDESKIGPNNDWEGSREHITYLGAGLGGEIHFWSLSLNLMTGYTLRTEQITNLGDATTVTFNNERDGEWRFQPSIDVSLMYGF